MHGIAANEGNWLLQAAEERLRRFDIPDSEIARIEQRGSVEREVTIESPASGYIIERNALPNAYVQPESKLYSIADLSTVWVYANVFQTDVGRLKPGDRAQVTVDAYPGRQFNGHIDQILPDVDQATRTVRVRLVQGYLEPREIETGARLDDSIVVLKGLKAGDRIVSSANFLVDSEAQLQGGMGGFAQSTAQANPEPKSADQAHIEFATRPSPARKGANTVRVNVTGTDGKPVAGAQVNVTFFMPAMPAMGMSAMHVASALADKGNGVYEGAIQLAAGGTWDVAITATRNGQVLANKKLSVNATGGM